MSDVILSVRELTEELRRSLEGRFPFVWVQGRGDQPYAARFRTCLF